MILVFFVLISCRAQYINMLVSHIIGCLISHPLILVAGTENNRTWRSKAQTEYWGNCLFEFEREKNYIRIQLLHSISIIHHRTFDHDSSHHVSFAAARDHAFRIWKAGLSQCADVWLGCLLQNHQRAWVHGNGPSAYSQSANPKANGWICRIVPEESPDLCFHLFARKVREWECRSGQTNWVSQYDPAIAPG